jgi:anti-sigma B factor antagonist
MPFETDRKALDSGVVVLSLSGTMTMGNQLQQLEWTIGELTKSNQNKIVFDMSHVTYVDSSAIGILVACHGNVRGAGGQMRLAGVGDRVLSIFKMVGIDSVLALDPTADASVAALAAKA